MNFQSLEYVRAVAEERSFTRAAAKLHVTQQTLSAHIAGLERELGRELFVRRAPLELTHEGAVFLAHADRLRAELANLRREVAGPDRLQAGTLRVGVAYTRGRALLPPVIERLCREYPNVRVQLDEGTNDEILANLAAGREDLAIFAVTAAQKRPGIVLEDFYEERIALLASKGLLSAHGLAPEGLAEPLSRGDLSPLKDLPFVLGGAADITGGLGLSLFADAGIDPVVRVQSNNMETLLALCLRGVGACLCPRNLLATAAPPEARAALEAFDLGPGASYRILFGLPGGGYRWAVTDAFMRLARDAVA
ncbi:MAG: LysR family transcriptional regulator [Coriobacteriia bacterium]|nr:LysR family transcriptional regulator [Coriobacteriia bacterium]